MYLKINMIDRICQVCFGNNALYVKPIIPVITVLTEPFSIFQMNMILRGDFPAAIAFYRPENPGWFRKL